jgi:alpha-glucosidase (family GH31 glycosyl hydrolase)
VSVIEEVVGNYSAAGLPLEVLWSDIDYQNNRFRTMEFDPGAWEAAVSTESHQQCRFDGSPEAVQYLESWALPVDGTIALARHVAMLSIIIHSR